MLTYPTPLLLVRSKLKSEHNLDVKFVQLDITDLKSIEAAKATIEKAEGKLDVLVNNAGMYTPPWYSNDYILTRLNVVGNGFMSADKGTLSEDLSVIRQAFDINFYGTIQTTLAFLPLIRKAQKGYGSIQFVSTDMASNGYQASPKGFLHNAVAYNTSKAALNSYVISLAKKLQEEDTGITVNAVTPGFTTTKLNGFAPGGNTTEQAAKILLPYAQLGPEDAATTCMLLSCAGVKIMFELTCCTGKFFDAKGEYIW